MDNLPPELKRSIESLTAGLQTARLPIHIATATLPIAREVQQALQAWHAGLTAAGQPGQGFYVSLAADLERVTWQTVGATPAFAETLAAYLDGLDIPPENLADLDQVLESVQPAQFGAWITGRMDSFDLGWYLAPQEGQLENALPLLPDSPDKARLVDWAARCAVDECVRVGRSLVSQEALSDVTVRIAADSPRQALETGLRLLDSLGLAAPPPPLLDAILRHDQPEVFASLWLGRAGAAKVGLLLPQPSTELALRLCNAAGQRNEKALAIFEACLGVDGPIFAEPQLLAEGWGVELHYAMDEARAG